MDRIVGFEAIPGVTARFYAWATARRAIVGDLFADVEQDAVLSGADRILDIGTGPGYLPLRLARRIPSSRVEGVDLSPAMIRLARTEAVKAGLAERVGFVEGNAAALPFPDASFDLAVSTLSLHHWRDRAGALREIHRVLSPGGAAWIYDIRKTTPAEVDRRTVERYGRLSAFVFLRLVRLHSFVTDAEARALLDGPAAIFSSRRIEDRDLFFRFILRK